MKHIYFYSYISRRKETGAKIGYGQGIAHCENAILDMDELDKIKLEIIAGIEKEFGDQPDYKIDTYDIHFIALSPLN